MRLNVSLDNPEDKDRPIDFASAIIEYFMHPVEHDDYNSKLKALTKLKMIVGHLNVYIRNTENILMINSGGVIKDE